MSQVYKAPVAARREFEAQSQQDRDAAMAFELGRQPERFGQLRGKQVGPARSHERKEALRAAGILERLGADYLRGMRQTSAYATEYQRLTSAVLHSDERLRDWDRKLARGPGPWTLRRTLDRQLRTLRPVERRALRRSLPIPQKRLVTAALIAARSFAHEQGHER